MPSTPPSPAPEGGLFKRMLAEAKDDELTDRAAMLTYYAVLAMFPMLLVLVSLIGMLGASSTQSLITNVVSLAPGQAKSILTEQIKNLQSANSGAVSLVAIVGLAAALWSASGYVAGFMRASNAIYEVGEGRPIWKTVPVRIGTTLALVLLIIVAGSAIALSGPVAESVGKAIGLGSVAVTVWGIAKWPVLLILVSLMFSLLYWAAPNIQQPKFKWISAGGLLAVVVLVIASAGFALYVANFSNYGATYGSLAGVIVFLVWLWIANIALLLGAELNAELQRGRQIEKGMAADREPYLPPRDSRNLDPAPDVAGLPDPKGDGVLDAEGEPRDEPDTGKEPSVKEAATAATTGGDPGTARREEAARHGAAGAAGAGAAGGAAAAAGGRGRGGDGPRDRDRDRAGDRDRDRERDGGARVDDRSGERDRDEGRSSTPGPSDDQQGRGHDRPADAGPDRGDAERTREGRGEDRRDARDQGPAEGVPPSPARPGASRSDDDRDAGGPASEPADRTIGKRRGGLVGRLRERLQDRDGG